LLYPALFSAFNIYLFFGFFFFVAFNLFYLAQLSLSLASSYPYQYAKVRSGRKGDEMGGGVEWAWHVGNFWLGEAAD